MVRVGGDGVGDAQHVTDDEDLPNLGVADVPLLPEALIHRGGQTRTFLRLRVVASPMRKQFDDAKHKDAPPLKTTRLRKTRQATYAKFRVTGISDIS